MDETGAVEAATGKKKSESQPDSDFPIRRCADKPATVRKQVLNLSGKQKEDSWKEWEKQEDRTASPSMRNWQVWC